MGDAYGNDFITISDDDGNEYTLEHLDTMELDGEYYLAFVPADVDVTDEKYGLLIMKRDGPEEDSYLVVPEDAELERVYQKFMERLFAEDDAEE
ncbi:MAG: DUF1292 domain-containing protein [Oscillospiraceae bacterium]|nr:DUF1292 domain-containing protein [Oscillospiraceae bacterium]